MKLTMNTIRLISRRLNKAPSAPSMPAPVAAAPPPTVDNSAEVAKQRKIEEERAKRAQGLSATDNTGGEGVNLEDENIAKPEAKKTLLGE